MRIINFLKTILSNCIITLIAHEPVHILVPPTPFSIFCCTTFYKNNTTQTYEKCTKCVLRNHHGESLHIEKESAYKEIPEEYYYREVPFLRRRGYKIKHNKVLKKLNTTQPSLPEEKIARDIQTYLQKLPKNHYLRILIDHQSLQSSTNWAFIDTINYSTNWFYTLFCWHSKNRKYSPLPKTDKIFFLAKAYEFNQCQKD